MALLRNTNPLRGPYDTHTHTSKQGLTKSQCQHWYLGGRVIKSVLAAGGIHWSQCVFNLTGRNIWSVAAPFVCSGSSKLPHIQQQNQQVVLLHRKIKNKHNCVVAGGFLTQAQGRAIQRCSSFVEAAWTVKSNWIKTELSLKGTDRRRASLVFRQQRFNRQISAGSSKSI